MTGSRRLEDYALVYRALNQVCADYGLNYTPDEYGNTLPDPSKITVVVGDCPTGADLYAREWAHGSLLVPEVHEAHWATTVPRAKAGPDRNKRMVDSGVDIALAFPEAGSRGTTNCMTLCRAAGVPVRTFDETGGYQDDPGFPPAPQNGA